MPTKKATAVKKKKPKDEVVREPGSIKIYATNVLTGATEYDFRIELMNEKIKFKDKWLYLVDSVVILTPNASKKLYEELKVYISKYEKDHEKLNLPGEVDVEDEFHQS